MRQLWPVFRMALRATAWKSTPDTPTQSLSGFVLWLVLALAAAASLQFVLAETGARFSPQGLTSEGGLLAVTSLVAALFVRGDGRATFLSANLAITVIVSAVFGVAFVTGPMLWPPIAGWARSFWLPLLAVYLAWNIVALFALLNSVDPRTFKRQLARATGLVVASLLAFALFPNYPVFIDSRFNAATANAWEYARSTLFSTGATNADEANAPRIDAALVELNQPALLEHAIARLAPQTKGKTDIYAIGIAGWSQENVFVRELNGAFESVLQTLPIEGRSLRLINNRDSVNASPVATRQNFATAVRALGRIMDKDEDVLLLFVTSHGYKSGIILWLPGVVSAVLSPIDVASVLEREGIKNRVVIVSACHSGVFVGPLADENSVVLTASDADSVSFGCSNEREWTYFGDAFFNHSLKPGTDLEGAFANASKLISEWEARDGLSSSKPTAHFGAVLTEKLTGIYKRGAAEEASPQELRPETAGMAPALP